MNDIIFNRKSYYSYLFRRNKNGINEFSTNSHYELTYLSEGEFKAHYSKGTFTVHAGEILFFPVDWKWDFEFGNCKEIVGIVFHFRYWPNVDELDYPPQIIKTDDKLRQLFSELPISENCENETKIDSRYIWQTYRVLDEVQSYMKKNDNKYIPSIQNALEYMRANDNYTIPELVTLSGMKKTKFYEVFEDLTGMTPVQAKHKIQAYKAEFLLGNTELSIDEIAEKLGFNSTPHFREVFRNRYGFSPKQIRQKKKY